MKQLYFITATLFFLSSNAQIHFSDPQFKSKLLSSRLTEPVALDLNHQGLVIDANNDGEIQTEEASNVSFLNIMDSGIVSVDGIENFTNLQSLYCSRNQIANLDYNLPVLKKLECYENRLTHLDVTNFPQLSFIDCNNNLIAALDLRSVTIASLDCSNNSISEIYFGQLQYCQLILRDNLLTNLEIINPGKLIDFIDISYNPLVNFNVEAYSIDNFTCINTRLANLDLSKIERESEVGNEFAIEHNPLLRTINFHNGAMDFCISDPFYECVNSFFSIEDNPLLESVCADEGSEMTYLQSFATFQGFALTSDCALAVNSNAGLQKSVIFPNPAEEILNIHSNTGITQVNILNTFGQMLSRTKNTTKSQDLKIDVSVLKSGTYLVEIVSDSGKSTQKFVKL